MKGIPRGDEGPGLGWMRKPRVQVSSPWGAEGRCLSRITELVAVRLYFWQRAAWWKEQGPANIPSNCAKSQRGRDPENSQDAAPFPLRPASSHAVTIRLPENAIASDGNWPAPPDTEVPRHTHHVEEKARVIGGQRGGR